MDKCEKDELFELRKEQKSLRQYLDEMADQGRYFMHDEGNRETTGTINLRLQEIADRIGELTDDVFAEMWDQVDVILGPEVDEERGCV